MTFVGAKKRTDIAYIYDSDVEDAHEEEGRFFNSPDAVDIFNIRAPTVYACFPEPIGGSFGSRCRREMETPRR